MPSFTYLTAALALTSAVAANPVQKRDAFSLQQVKHNIHLKNGPGQIAKTLRKYGKAVPEHIQAAADTRANAVTALASGTEPANPSDDYDSSYLSPVTIGTTTVNLDFDTGSSDLWVFSSLQASTQLTGHDYYKVDASKVKSGYTWKIGYADGSGASGKVYADKVTVGGVTATSQAVEAATSVSSTFSQDRDTDGLLGLAFSSINTVSPTPQSTWFDTVKSSLAKQLFAVNLKYHAAGTYDFGFIDSAKYTGAITYVNVDNSDGFWGFSATGYSVGTAAAVKTSIAGIVDTGTTLIYVDAAIAKAYWSKVTGAKVDNTQGGYVFPCSATLPSFSITVGGVAQTVPGKFINYAPISTGSSTCFGGIQTNDGVGFNIFGDIFLKSKYVIHDVSTGSPRLGFAQQAGVTA
ncbi:aspartic peptidase domain-containing protein [Boeremia exigua]|uniref:aspartic peptidase domain-containing protein n=1 Tax=Boeremia exigua TaxID=749465 RepID=UPI001E8CD9A9|nr:aspartic peptidase domain-containing protein [Boeremia exigua]KAH6644538.1 aspartic peptidase domain-containing protein [Boeremia exigua]